MRPHPDLAAMRSAYARAGLDEAAATAGPLELFDRWLADAVAAGLPEPNAMVVATATPEGAPSARTVLLKDADERGFTFFTNTASQKGAELAANPRAALVFPWHALERQVRVTGPVSAVDRAEAADYFASRPHGSQLGAWASPQSQVIGRRADLEARLADVSGRWPEGVAVPLPDFWGGYRVVPAEVEFWAGRADRLHDRLRYRRARSDSGGGWLRERLAP
jgi:pyridoxamine 5'-phosphate oxidase